jgi:hypothetical protein
MERDELVDFQEFEYLPQDMQMEVLSQYPDILARTRRLSKNLSDVSESKYFSEICNLPISKNEIKNYFERLPYGLPDRFDVFIWNVTQNLTDFNVIRVTENTITPLVIFKFRRSKYEKEVVELEKEGNDYIVGNQPYRVEKRGREGLNIETILNLMYAYDYDLITKYYIYFNRGCDKIRQNFSKKKILQELDMYHSNIDKTNYADLLAHVFYLERHLSFFGKYGSKRPYLSYDIILDDNFYPVSVVDEDSQVIEPETLMIKMVKHAERLYIGLRNLIIRNV